MDRLYQSRDRVRARMRHIPPMHRPFLGMPGPVWTLAMWSAVCSILLMLSLVFPLDPTAPFPNETLAASIYLGAGACVLMATRDRTPSWLIHALVVGILVFTVAISSTSNELEIAVLGLGAVIIALYTGYWFPAPVALSYTAAWSVAMVMLLTARDMVEPLVMMWAATTAVSWVAVLSSTALQRYLNEHATFDPLTGLLTGMGIRIAVSALHARAFIPQTVSVAYINLTGLQNVNRKEGRIAGDRILVEVADALVEGARETDVVGRVGGSEFLLVCVNASGEDVIDAVTRIGGAFPIGFSFGVAEWDADDTFGQAVSEADRMMFLMKRDIQSDAAFGYSRNSRTMGSNRKRGADARRHGS